MVTYDHDLKVSACRYANSHLPVSLLSDDVLSEIFSLNLAGEFNEPRYRAIRTTRYTSQVCHHWRAVAIGSPALWCDMDLRRCGPEWAEELWDRSKKSLVIIRIDSDKQLKDMHISQLRGLHVVTTASINAGIWDKLTLHPDVLNTQLETLDINRSDGHNLLNPDVLHLKIPAMVNPGSQQSLKTLMLTGYTTDFQSPIFSNLSVLYVKDVSLSVRVWIDILEAMPTLIELNIQDSISTGDMNAIDHIPPRRLVQLPHLKEFVAFGSVNVVNALFACVILPPLCSLQFHFKRGGSSVEPDMCAIFAQYSRAMTDDAVKKCGYSLYVDTFYGDLCFYNQDEQDLIQNRTAVRNYLYFEHYAGDYDQLIQVLSAIGSILPPITTMFFCFKLDQWNPQCIPHLYKFTALKSLRLPAVDDHFEVLLPYLSSVEPLFPSLVILSFIPDITPGRQLPQQIISAVQWRRMHHPSSIECVRILKNPHRKWTDIYFSTHEVQVLNALGARVELQ